jgi:ribosome-associated heat shock protein Hsp15
MNDRENPEAKSEIRIDKWLWAARFFKTRSLAADAVAGGKVALNGARPKPSRIIRPGDRLSIRRGAYEWSIIVKGTCNYRGPASDAVALYEETEESRTKRQAAMAQLKLERPAVFDSPRRPSKKDRRAIAKFTNRKW